MSDHIPSTVTVTRFEISSIEVKAAILRSRAEFHRELDDVVMAQTLDEAADIIDEFIRGVVAHDAPRETVSA